MTAVRCCLPSGPVHSRPRLHWGLTMPDSQERITFKICGVIQGAAEGRFAIAALVVVTVLVLAMMVWWRAYR
jgi:hypothetical protein